MEQLEVDMRETLLTLTSDIVAAHVSNNDVAAGDVKTLIEDVYGALSGIGGEGEREEPRPDPAVSVRASVKKDHIVCLDCGKKMKMLKRHLSTEHGLSIDEYKARWDLPSDYPVVAPSYAARRRDLAIEIGLGRKPGQKRGRKKKAA